MNYTEFEETAAELPYEMVKAVHCRSALRTLTSVKIFLDEPQNGENGRIALAAFSDLSRAIVKSIFPTEASISETSFTLAYAQGSLRNYVENAEDFSFGYLACHEALRDCLSETPRTQNATILARKFAELNATDLHAHLPTRFKLLTIPIRIDLGKVKTASNVRDLYTLTELVPGGGLPGSPKYSPYDLRLALRHAGEHWQYWLAWYDGFFEGKPLPWELQRRVALLPDEDWDQGPEHIAKCIEDIRAKYLAEKAPVAETVEFDGDTSKFQAVPLPLEKPDLIGATLSQVQDAVEDVLATPANGLHDNSLEIRKLRRTLERYGNDPQQIEMGLVSVQKGLTRQLLSDELPASEENLALRDALEDGARAIRATHPEVAENRKILNEQVIRELPDGAKEKLEEALPVLTAISDDALADDWQHDIPQLINDATTPLPSGAPPLPGVDETIRIFSRAAKMSLLMKSADVVHSIDKGAAYKAATIALLLKELVTIGLAIL